MRKQLQPRFVERAAKTYAGQNILQRTAVRQVIMYVVGRNDRCSGQLTQSRQLCQATAIVLAIKAGRSDRKPIIVKDIPQPFHRVDELLVEHSRRLDYSQHILVTINDIVQRKMALALGRPAFAEGQQAA